MNCRPPSLIHLRGRSPVSVQQYRSTQPALTKLPTASLNYLLRHRLDKIFSLENHIKNVMKLATSSRLRRYTAVTPNTEVVPSPRETKTFDIRRATLRSRISDCCVEVDLPDDELETICDKIISNIGGSLKYLRKGDTCDVPSCQHAEYSILLHHLRNPETKPYNYFGVSKPCCLACSLFFAAYRETLETRAE
jgi:hypothetical protein